MILNPAEHKLEQEDRDIRKKEGGVEDQRESQRVWACQREEGEMQESKGEGVGADQKEAGRRQAGLRLLG